MEGGYGTLAVLHESDPCTGYDSWRDTHNEHRVHNHFGMVLEWALEKTHRLGHINVEVDHVGENERRIIIRARGCCTASKLEMKRHNHTVCKMCWKAADECVQKAATATTIRYAVTIYQHALVGEHAEAAACRAALDKLEFLDPIMNLRKEYDNIKDLRPLDLGPYLKNKYDGHRIST